MTATVSSAGETTGSAVANRAGPRGDRRPGGRTNRGSVTSLPSVPELHIAQHEEADRLVSEDPLALLVAMVLDQQIGIQTTADTSAGA